ncbi:NAD-dependent epimerase/dehydratase family protein [Deinococcus altitudinis]|uniref:NAD-dependent epimerase/dehydratase family protein n=1 Tax=Deinococcus altitudinis TaxID=468914 RepID=UPI003891BBBF
MHILVTGATGFLGGVAARELLRAGHQVTATGRDPVRAKALEGSGVHFLAADLRRPGAAAALLPGVDAALHCAARSSLWGRWEDFVQDNVVVSTDLARACSERGVRLVHVSTPSVYNSGRLHTNVPESAPIGPRFDSLYARSKYLAEVQVRSVLPEAAVLRPRGIYGPGDPSIVPKLAQALRSGRLPRLSSGEVHTELTHVLNVVHAARLALETPAAGVFNVTDGVTTPIWATLDRLADVLGVARPRSRLPAWMTARLVEGAAGLLEQVYRLHPDAPEPPLIASGVRLLTRSMTLDLSRARERLGYVPPVHPVQGLEEVMAGLISAGLKP